MQTDQQQPDWIVQYREHGRGGCGEVEVYRGPRAFTALTKAEDELDKHYGIGGYEIIGMRRVEAKRPQVSH